MGWWRSLLIVLKSPMKKEKKVGLKQKKSMGRAYKTPQISTQRINTSIWGGGYAY